MGARRWSDVELATAVSASHSWRGVLRSLSLKATSAGALRSVQGHARRLELDTSHFTHRRTWSDKQLRSAIRSGETWAEVLEQLGLSDRTEARVRVRGHAVRLGLDIAHLQSEVARAACVDLHDMQPKSERLRAAAEPIAITWFTLRGVPVAMPTEPSAYDLLATTAEGVQRVQVKSGTRATHAGGYLVSVGRRPYSTEHNGLLVPYDPDELDFFFIVEGGGGILLIPAAAIAGRTTIDTVAHSVYRVGDASSLLVGAA